MARAGERGATAPIVAAVLLTLFGIGAYVVDVGALFEERRDLQNGADAAALAVALDCANDGICDSAAAQPEAERVAALNSNDLAATVTAPDIVFDLANQEVTVTVHTLDATDGDGEINHVLAPVFGQNSEAVSATAVAGWSGVNPGGGVPITVSTCEWVDFVADPNDPSTWDDPSAWNFGDSSITDPSDPGYQIIVLHSGNGGNGFPICGSGPGQDVDGDGDRAQGGFGYLDASNCEAQLSYDNNGVAWMLGQTGNGNLGALDCELSDLKDQTVLVPIFQDIADGNACQEPPGKNCYAIIGLAAFHILDVDANGQFANQDDICPSNQTCFGGYFAGFSELAEDNGAGGGGGLPNFGAAEVFLIG